MASNVINFGRTENISRLTGTMFGFATVFQELSLSRYSGSSGGLLTCVPTHGSAVPNLDRFLKPSAVENLNIDADFEVNGSHARVVVANRTTIPRAFM